MIVQIVIELDANPGSRPMMIDAGRTKVDEDYAPVSPRGTDSPLLQLFFLIVEIRETLSRFPSTGCST